MMYSQETDLANVAWKQYIYKVKSFSFVGLFILQLIVLFFSSSGTGMYGSGNGHIQVSVKTYASDMVIICTFIWIIVIAFGLTKKGYKDMDFTFVTNRLSSCLSDIGLLMTLSLIGGVTSSLSSYLLRLAMYTTTDASLIASSAFKLPLPVLAQGIAASSLYILLLSAIAYCFGMLVEVSKTFIFIIPAVLFGLVRSQSPLFLKMFQFFSQETILLIFTGKVIFAAGILFLFSIMIYHRMEVRR